MRPFELVRVKKGDRGEAEWNASNEKRFQCVQKSWTVVINLLSMWKGRYLQINNEILVETT